MERVETAYSRTVEGGSLGFAVSLTLALVIRAIWGTRLNSGDWSVYEFPIVFGIIFLSLIVRGYVGHRKLLKRLELMLAKDGYWIHWSYDREAWIRFVESEWLRSRRKARAAPWKLAVIGLFFGPVLWRHIYLPVVTRAVLGAALGVAAGCFMAAGVYLQSRRSYQRQLCDPGDCYIGSEGVFQAGKYETWRAYGTVFGGGRVEPGNPAMLSLIARVSRGRGASSPYEIRVPIPKGSEQAAEDILARLGAHFRRES